MLKFNFVLILLIIIYLHGTIPLCNGSNHIITIENIGDISSNDWIFAVGGDPTIPTLYSIHQTNEGNEKRLEDKVVVTSGVEFEANYYCRDHGVNKWTSFRAENILIHKLNADQIANDFCV